MESSEAISTARTSVVQVRNLGTITVHVHDLERSVRFYEEVLGFKKGEEQMMAPAMMMQTADVQIYLNPGSDDMGRREGACPEISIGLVVSGVRAGAERLREAGVPIIGDYYQMSDSFASVQIADPDGNMIELMGNP